MAAGGVALGSPCAPTATSPRPGSSTSASACSPPLAVAAAGWIPALVQVQRDFQDQLGLALGIVSSGVAWACCWWCRSRSCSSTPTAGAWRSGCSRRCACCGSCRRRSFLLRLTPRRRRRVPEPVAARPGHTAPAARPTLARSDTRHALLADARRFLLRQRLLADAACAPGGLPRGPGRGGDHRRLGGRRGRRSRASSARRAAAGSPTAWSASSCTSRASRSWWARWRRSPRSATAPAHWAIYGYAVLLGLGYSVPPRSSRRW